MLPINIVELLVNDLDPNLINLFDIKVRNLPFTTELKLFPAINTSRFLEFLNAERIAVNSSCSIVYAVDEFEIDFASNTVKHKQLTPTGNPTDAYLSVECMSGAKKVWTFSDVEMTEAYSAWLKSVGGIICNDDECDYSTMGFGDI